MKHTLIWVLSWTVLGPAPESGQLAKYETRADCEQARIQKRDEYAAKKQRIVSACNIRSQ